MLSENQFEVVIERILPGGLGLAHAEGRTVMVALAAPGDHLRVQVDRVKGNVAFGSIKEIVEPSPVRIEPPCPYFGRCGGCDFQQLTYEAQLEAKVEIIRDCLRRLGGIENVPDFQITPAPKQWHYRARAQWQYDSARRRLGYFESGSRHVCDVAECAVLAPELQQELEQLRELMHEDSIADDARHFRAIAGDDAVSIVDDKGRDPTNRGPRTGSPRGVVDREGAGGNATVREGARSIARTIHGETYELNAESFFQTNVDLVPQLIDTALAGAADQTAVELYCGLGLFTLPLARRFKSVMAVEGDKVAAKFAENNVGRAGLQTVEVVNADVADWLDLECGGRVPTRRERRFGSSRESRTEGIQSAVKAGALQIDFLLLDPPRTGAESRVITGILRLKPKRICYVSCDPATLGRDLKKLIGGGYAIESIAAFDMFPQTHHVETVVQMTC